MLDQHGEERRGGQSGRQGLRPVVWTGRSSAASGSLDTGDTIAMLQLSVRLSGLDTRSSTARAKSTDKAFTLSDGCQTHQPTGSKPWSPFCASRYAAR